MRFVIDFVSRLRVSPAVQNVEPEPISEPPVSLAINDGPVADTVAAIFAPIMESLLRVEKLIDMLPDKVK
jgi:hypothetical protein